MQQPKEQKSIPSDQVVLTIDSPNSTHKQSLKKSPDLTSEEKPQDPPTIPRTLPLESGADSEDHHSESESNKELIKEEEHHATEKDGSKKSNINVRAIAEWTAFIFSTACLVSSLTIPYLSHRILWGLHIWKWSLTILVIFCGRLVSSWFVRFAVYLIEQNLMLREKVLYFVYGLRRGVQICVWLALVLLAWTRIFDQDDRVSNHSHMILKKVTRVLIAALVGSIIWLVKIVLVKMLASSFHVSTFFDRMKKSVYHQYILETLSGERLPPVHSVVSRLPSQTKSMHRSLAWLSMRKDGMGIDMEQLRKLSRGTPSTWSMKRLMSHVMSTGLSTNSKTVDELMEDFKEEGKRIFKQVAKDGAKYIEEDDLVKILQNEEVQTLLTFFQAAETKKIGKSAFKEWVVNAYKERKDLAHALNDTNTAVQQLHKLASAVVIVIIIVVYLLVMGVATTKVIFVITSQLLLVGFMFGNTCKTIFEAIIFVFVMHPFDVGDRCVIDGVQMEVDEINILTTIFLRFDKEKIYYPNAVLIKKVISNFNRSPEMGDNIEFSIDVSTPESIFNDMKTEIRTYIENNSKHWKARHWVVVKEIEEVNKMKITLYVLHKINFQNFMERNIRRSELLFELKRIFERLGIKYHLLPQQIHLTQFTMATERIQVS